MALSSWNWVQRFVRNDTRLILRDRMLATLLLVVFLMGLGLRYALPAIDRSLADGGVMPSERVAFRFSDIFPIFVAFVAYWQSALLPGTVFGFLLLDEKEDDTLTVLRVTPTPLTRYVTYRVALPMILAFAFALVLPSMMGHCPPPAALHLPLALVASLTAPSTALLLAVYAENKVQGLAFTKFGGVAGLTIIVGYFIPGNWQWLAGAFPPFLVAKAYWMSRSGDPMTFVALALSALGQIVLLTFLIRRFQRVARA